MKRENSLCLLNCSKFLPYFRRQESQYEMTGLYSEAQDDSSADLPHDTESDSLPSSVAVQSVTVSTTLTNPAVTTTCITASAPETVIKCHSRQPSASLMDREKTFHNNDTVDDELSRDCGILSCRPARIQKMARIKVRLLLFMSNLFRKILINLHPLPLDFCITPINAGDTSTSR